AAGGNESPAEDPESNDPPADSDTELERIWSRISNLTGGKAVNDTAPKAEQSEDDEFLPLEPETLEKAQLTESDLEALVLKFLLNRGESSGRLVCEQLRLPFKLI